MRNCVKRKFKLLGTVSLILFLSLLFLPMEAVQNQPSDVKYHNYAALTQAMKNLAGANPNITKLQSIGRTLGGRELWMLQVSGKGKALEKQALLIAANLEGDHLIGSMVVLGIAEYLVKGYGKDEKVTAILDKRTFYIVPRLNPDGAEAFFKAVRHEHPGNFNPRDEDYDWKVDEDGSEDLNGDGIITMMRAKDKEGSWIVDEKDPRLMKKKDTDSPFDALYKLYPEGIDNDGDELYNEDGPGGFNINRNFPHNFGYKPKGLKVYPVSEVETQALIDFMTRFDPNLKTQAHKNICGVLMFSKYDNLAAGTGIECGTPTFPEPPRGAAPAMGGFMFFRMGRRGGADATPQPRPTDPQPKRTETRDQNIFKAVSEKYKEITKITSAKSDKPFGSLLEYAYFQYGVPSFSANLWSLREAARPPGRMMPRSDRQESPQPQRQAQQTTMDRSAMMQRFMASGGGAAQRQPGTSDNDAGWLKWIDEKNEGKGFVAWTKFNHKQLGEVEIGGFEPHLRINPPADQIPALTKSHTEFALYLAGQFAEIALDEPEIEKLSPNLFRLTLKVQNKGKFPYSIAMGTRTRNINSIVLQLKFEDDKKMELFGGSKRTNISTLAAGGENEYMWTIISPPGKKIDINLWARHGGGTIKKTIVLK